MSGEVIVFLEDLKALLMDLNLEGENAEILVEVIEMVDNKIVDLEGDLL